MPKKCQTIKVTGFVRFFSLNTFEKLYFEYILKKKDHILIVIYSKLIYNFWCYKYLK